MRYTMHMELNCAGCGSNRFSLGHGMGEELMVTCEDCGRELGTMAKLKQMVSDHVLKNSRIPNPVRSEESTAEKPDKRT